MRVAEQLSDLALAGVVQEKLLVGGNMTPRCVASVPLWPPGRYIYQNAKLIKFTA